MAEHLLCKQGVVGSIPSASTGSWCAVVDDCHGKAERSGGVLRDVAWYVIFVSVKRLVRAARAAIRGLTRRVAVCSGRRERSVFGMTGLARVSSMSRGGWFGRSLCC